MHTCNIREKKQGSSYCSDCDSLTTHFSNYYKVGVDKMRIFLKDHLGSFQLVDYEMLKNIRKKEKITSFKQLCGRFPKRKKEEINEETKVLDIDTECLVELVRRLTREQPNTGIVININGNLRTVSSLQTEKV